MIPQIWGTIAVVWTTITILVLKVFDIVLAMTNGQWNSQVLANLMFDWMFRGGGDFGRGATIAIIIMLAVHADHDLEHPPGEQRDGRALRWPPRPAKSFAGRFGVHLAVLVFVVLWTHPDARPPGLLAARQGPDHRLRLVDGASPARRRPRPAACRRPPTQVEKDGKFVIEGNIFGDGPARDSQRLRHARRRRRPQFAAGADRRPRRRRDACTVNADGSFVHVVADAVRRRARPAHLSIASSAPPRFTIDNYETVLFSEGIGHSFINSLTVTIPATVIPILIAAFAAYALAWMQFPGRALLIAVVVGLLVVPLQMSLIPLLQLYNGVGAVLRRAGEDLSRHLAGAYRLRPAARHLSAAQLHGRPAARDHGIGAHRRRQRLRDLHQDRAAAVLPGARLLRHLPVPLGLERPAGRHGLPRRAGRPARADRQAVNLLGSRGGNWEILTASAFVTIIVPLIVFFSLQRYFVRGLLAGSVKGG